MVCALGGAGYYFGMANQTYNTNAGINNLVNPQSSKTRQTPPKTHFTGPQSKEISTKKKRK